MVGSQLFVRASHGNDKLKIIQRAAIPGAVNRQEDDSLGRTRIEITCAACGGHLGHVFKGEGFPTPSTFAGYMRDLINLTN